MEAGKALGASLEIIKMLYETAETYRRLEKINANILNELALLISIKEQIQSCRRMENNLIIDNYLIDINKKLIKFKDIVESIGKQNFFKKIIYTRKIEKIGKEISKAMKKLKFLLDLKKDMQQSARLDVANIITDIKAREFWENNFGSDHTFVQANLFFSAIRMNTSLISTEIDFLKKVINDDNDKYISAFEFQEWLDFFGDFSVAMRRTIDSLFDPNTYDIFEWYQKNISKSIIKALLTEKLFIIRKHSNQKGIFILNFKYQQEIGELYIKNKDNEFHLEMLLSMKPFEAQIFCQIDKKKSSNLREIANSLEYVINPQNQIQYNEWEQERQNHLDQKINSESIPQHSSLETLLELPGISHLKNGVETIVDTSVGVVMDVFTWLTPR